MTMRSCVFTAVVLAGFLGGVLTPVGLQAQTVRLHGAITMEKLISAQKSAIEGQSGAKLEVIGNTAGRGLMDLLAGEADVAMLGGSLKGVAEALNMLKPGSASAAGLVETPFGSVKIVLVAQPAVGVKSITAAQAKDILEGKISSWKEVGGADVPVRVVLPAVGEGAWVSVRDQIMEGGAFAKNAIQRTSSKEIPAVIQQLPGAIAFLTEKNAAGLNVIGCDKEIQMPMLFVTKGEPSGDVKKVLDSIRAVVK